ncbi:MAG: hypothetical protein CMB73_08080 [Euryarchaeota archaeon]|nr:hypothetical protein [Euryarchaeota archaeon]
MSNFASAEEDLIELQKLSSTSVNSENVDSRPLVEFFFAKGYENVTEMLEGMDGIVNTIHWRIDAEQEGLDWPNDDANIRAGQLGVYEYPAIVINGELYIGEYSEDSIKSHIESLDSAQKIPSAVEVEGVVQIAQQSDGLFRVIMDLNMSPNNDLPIGTTANLILTENYAIDDFGRSADNLVREWKPETGFALQQNNTTDVYWTLTDIHLEAAGVNFNEKSRGWQIQIVFFNEFATQETSILSVHRIELNPTQNQIELNDFMIFIPILIAMILVIIVILRSINNVDESLPEISASWKDSDSSRLIIKIIAKTKTIQLNKVSAEPPWKIQGKVKEIIIEKDSETSFSIKFAKQLDQNVVIKIGLEIEDLGEWTQTIEMPTKQRI